MGRIKKTDLKIISSARIALFLPILNILLLPHRSYIITVTAATFFEEEKFRFEVLDSAPSIANILKYPELANFTKCFDIFNSTRVASKNGDALKDTNKYSDSVLGFNKLNLDGINFVPKRIKLWPKGVMAVKIEPTFKRSEQLLIGCAIRWFHDYSCVNVVDATSEDKGYLYISKSDPRGGCFTEEMGYQGDKMQILNLQSDTSCWELGTIIHEFFHVLGFAHEQQREDRDEYINIHQSNIPSWLRPQFKKLGSELGIQHVHIGEYDYKSIMHYSRSLPQAGGRPFMTSKMNPIDYNNQLMGQRIAPTEKDKDKINLLYHCPHEEECKDEKPTGICQELCRSDDRKDLKKYLKKNCPKTCGFCSSGYIARDDTSNELYKEEDDLLPPVCELSQWTSWTTCSATCGKAFRSRERIQLVSDAENCEGPLTEKKTCDLAECPVCKLTQWTEWSDCSTSCADEKGMNYRTRKVIKKPTGVKCSKRLFDVKKCQATTRCPVDCEIGDWQSWGRCDSLLCLSIRTRFVHTQPKNGGKDCPSKFQSRVCNSDCHRQGSIVNLGCIDDERCLLLSLKPMNYSTAWADCRSHGGDRLAHLDTLETYYALKARHEKFKKAFWLWTNNPACGITSGHWVGAKVTSSDDWFWVDNERSRDGESFKRKWPTFDLRFHRISNAAGPAVYVSLIDMKFRNGGFRDVKCGYICEFKRR